MKIRVLSIIVGCLVLFGCNASISEVEKGAQSAEHWLTIVDSEAFENKAKAVETVTVAMSDEGKWKITGYFIQ